MRLRFLTASGVDDKIAPEQLLAIQRSFPFVEWGVLLSPSAVTKPRYATTGWLGQLCHGPFEEIRLAGHVCGQWAKDVCRGVFPGDVHARRFGRIQLNIAVHMSLITAPERMAACLPHGPEYILQVGEDTDAGIGLARQLRGMGLPVSVLFDASGGHGVLPAKWPELPEDVPCGFAGGLGPDNLDEQLAHLASVLGERTIWVDMESRIRSDTNKFDLDKVRRCLAIARRYVD